MKLGASNKVLTNEPCLNRTRFQQQLQVQLLNLFNKFATHILAVLTSQAHVLIKKINKKKPSAYCSFVVCHINDYLCGCTYMNGFVRLLQKPDLQVPIEGRLGRITKLMLFLLFLAHFEINVMWPHAISQRMCIPLFTIHYIPLFYLLVLREA